MNIILFKKKVHRTQNGIVGTLLVWCANEILWLCTKQKHEGTIASTVFKARDIPYTNVMLHLDGEDIAFVASTNHPPKVWTIHVLAFKWPQCNCPLVAHE
jgi:hypothetical protein